MSTVWAAADLHLNHCKILGFESEHRPFKNIVEHDDAIIDRLNEVVRPRDTLLLLGDIYLGKADEYFAYRMKQLPGIITLVMGNHDQFEPGEYTYHFPEVCAYKVKYGFLFSHIPIHPQEVIRWRGNVHGHTHSKVIYKQDCWPTHDRRYLCVSLESKSLLGQPLGTPWHLDDIRAYLPEQE